MGQCEGTGYFPENDQSSLLWQEAHAKSKHEFKEIVDGKVIECDGWHFVKCPDCNGSGRRTNK
jgi:DnaJ-class molecular chaperone